MPTVVTFGEIMLRLSPPGFERFLQTPAFVATAIASAAKAALPSDKKLLRSLRR